MSWFHKFWRPHCDHCREEQRCRTCEVYERELDAARIQIRELIQSIERLVAPKPDLSSSVELHEIEPISKKPVPWGIRKRLLEQEDKAKAQILKEQAEIQKSAEMMEARSVEIDELEKETGVG